MKKLLAILFISAALFASCANGEEVPDHVKNEKQATIPTDTLQNKPTAGPSNADTP